MKSVTDDDKVIIEDFDMKYYYWRSTTFVCKGWEEEVGVGLMDMLNACFTKFSTGPFL